MKSSCQYAYYGFEYLPIPIWLVRFTNDIWYLCTFVRSFDERLDFFLGRFVFIYLLIERTNERNKSKVRKRKTRIESRCICVCVCEMKQRAGSTFKIAYLLCFALHTYTYVCLLNTFQSHSNNRKKRDFSLSLFWSFKNELKWEQLRYAVDSTRSNESRLFIHPSAHSNSLNVFLSMWIALLCK